MSMWSKAAPFFTALAGAGLVACTAAPDEGARFREAVPKSDDVALRVPAGSGAAVSTRGLRILSPGGGAMASSEAKFYSFTRDLTREVDGVTSGILSSVWALASTQPTTVESKRAVWGPGSSSALDPNEWRFVVVENATGEYDYALEGRKKAGGDFVAVLRGKGFGSEHPSHRTGSFEVDGDAYRALEPSRGAEEGSAKVTYSLATFPTAIGVALRTGAEASWDITVTRDEAGAGKVDITGKGDVDGDGATAQEDVTLASRWDASGAGRADVTMSNGDLPQSVTATECWSSAFSRVYYEDTVQSEPTVGAKAACAFAAE